MPEQTKSLLPEKPAANTPKDVAQSALDQMYGYFSRVA